MAYDKIIPIRQRMDNCLGYVLNEEKNSLDHALTYAENPDKAHQLVTGINCQAATAYSEMQAIIDRCTANVYQSYFRNRGKAPMPLLTDWRNEVLKQVDPEAREIALAAELITEGSLNVFAHPGNVDMSCRCFSTQRQWQKSWASLHRRDMS